VDWLELNGLLSFVLAVPLGYLPVVGTVLGMLGAHAAWGWSWMYCIGVMLLAPAAILWAVGLVALALPGLRG
jgi:hypothetical protein